MKESISMSEAIERITEICEHYKVPITQYKENDLPDGRQGSDDIISINRQMGYNFDQDKPGYFARYLPWIRSMTTLEPEEFDQLLQHGKNVRDCIEELNDYLANKLITEIE